MGIDKILHFSISCIINAGLYFIFSKYTQKWYFKYLAVLCSLIIGLVKEINDPIFNKNDLLANGLGVILSLIIIKVIRELK